MPTFSNDSAFLYKTPSLAPFPLPTIMATGVASPKAHGHDTTSTETAWVNDKAKSLLIISQIVSTINEITMISGTKILATLSASFAIGALVTETFLTRSIILLKVVSSPTLVARAKK